MRVYVSYCNTGTDHLISKLSLSASVVSSPSEYLQRVASTCRDTEEGRTFTQGHEVLVVPHDEPILMLHWHITKILVHHSRILFVLVYVYTSQVFLFILCI